MSCGAWNFTGGGSRSSHDPGGTYEECMRATQVPKCVPSGDPPSHDFIRDVPHGKKGAVRFRPRGDPQFSSISGIFPGKQTIQRGVPRLPQPHRDDFPGQHQPRGSRGPHFLPGKKHSLYENKKQTDELVEREAFLMGNSTVSTGPFSIASCMFTRGYFIGTSIPRAWQFSLEADAF